MPDEGIFAPPVDDHVETDGSIPDVCHAHEQTRGWKRFVVDPRPWCDHAIEFVLAFASAAARELFGGLRRDSAILGITRDVATMSEIIDTVKQDVAADIVALHDTLRETRALLTDVQVVAAACPSYHPAKEPISLDKGPDGTVNKVFGLRDSDLRQRRETSHDLRPVPKINNPMRVSQWNDSSVAHDARMAVANEMSITIDGVRYVAVRVDESERDKSAHSLFRKMV